MAVSLTIVDAREDIAGPSVTQVPDGFQVVVRRCADGADVLVLPGSAERANAASRTPIDRLIAVHSFTVERNRPGCAEIAIVDGEGAEWRLFLGGETGLELATCLRGGEASCSPGTHEAALARRANAEADAMELENAERRRGLGGDPQAPLTVLKWSVEEVADTKGDQTVALRLHGDGRAVEGHLSPYLAASLSACLGQFVAKALTEPKRER